MSDSGDGERNTTTLRQATGERGGVEECGGVWGGGREVAIGRPAEANVWMLIGRTDFSSSL